MGEPATETFLITGATGFLGGHLLAALIKRGHQVVVLGRRRGDLSLKERIAGILQWFGLAADPGQVETVEADLLAPRCGLDKSRYQAICLRATQLVHCASDTRFAESIRDASIETNVRALSSVLELARESRLSFFHYLSTAYATGCDSPCCQERLAAPSSYTNVYEETKAFAEREISAQCSRHGIPYTIIRPSIVYGDSRTGRSTAFTALYHHVRSLGLIRDIYLKEIRDRGGEKAHRHGIYLKNQETLHLPIRIRLPHPGQINLIPVDYFVAATLAILERPESGQVYNVTCDQPAKMEELASYCETFLNIEGIRIDYGNPSGFLEENPAEALFNKFVEPYRPYLSDTRVFDRNNTDRVTAGLPPPRLTYERFRRCMEYAVSVNWGN